MAPWAISSLVPFLTAEKTFIDHRAFRPIKMSLFFASRAHYDFVKASVLDDVGLSTKVCLPQHFILFFNKVNFWRRRKYNRDDVVLIPLYQRAGYLLDRTQVLDAVDDFFCSSQQRNSRELNSYRYLSILGDSA